MGLEERKKQEEITNWLSTQTDATVYWDKKPPEDIDTFTYTGDGQPDLLVVGKNLTVATEMKDGTDSSGVYGGTPSTSPLLEAIRV